MLQMVNSVQESVYRCTADGCLLPRQVVGVSHTEKVLLFPKQSVAKCQLPVLSREKGTSNHNPFVLSI